MAHLFRCQRDDYHLCAHGAPVRGTRQGCHRCFHPPPHGNATQNGTFGGWRPRGRSAHRHHCKGRCVRGARRREDTCRRHCDAGREFYDRRCSLCRREHDHRRAYSSRKARGKPGVGRHHPQSRQAAVEGTTDWRRHRFGTNHPHGASRPKQQSACAARR